MNIGVGKIGKSILFNPKSWGATGGDMDAPKYFENLFLNNPEHTFYIIGSSDFGRLSSSDQLRLNRHGNVIDTWKGVKMHVKEDGYKNTLNLENWFVENNVKLDTAVIVAGPTGTSNVAGKTTRMRDPSALGKPLDMLALYAGPILNILNITMMPYVLIVNDPRYFPMHAKDLFNRPAKVLGQYDDVVTMSSKENYTSGQTIETPIPTSYAAMETIFFYGLDRENVRMASLESFFDDTPEDTKDINFMIVLNEGRPSRYKLLKEAILNDITDVSIYGQWDPEIIGDDSRFKGSLGFHELHAMLPRVKYTYCIPIKKGWVTSKFWEMIQHGIIPFLHPTYDEKDALKAPPFLKVKNSSELKAKIQFLEENPEAYETLKTNLQNMIKDEHYSGKLMNDTIMNAVYEITTK